MTLHVVFDDTALMPDALRALVGVDRYGSLVFQRRTRREAIEAFAEAAGAASMTVLSVPEDIDDLLEKLRQGDQERQYLVCPSNLVPMCPPESVVAFLKQVAHSTHSLHVPVENARDRRGWALMRPPLLAKLFRHYRDGTLDDFYEEYGDTLSDVGGRLKLIDVSDERTLLDFLSGQFDARHFNAIERHDYTVTKRSTDRSKLKREFDYYALIPAAMQMFMVRPFDFQDDGATASYRMERLSIPDMALQWVHASLQPQEFERFLDHIFHFISLRPERRPTKEQAGAVRESLYVDKVRERISALKIAPAYPKLEPLLASAVGGIDSLLQRYLDVFERSRSRLPSSTLVIGHGDPCFSNILYSKTNQLLRLIDPRGATGDDDLYTDPYYDVAKLSHSIQGLYDFINHDKFDIVVDEGLKLELLIETPPEAWAAEMFRQRLERHGFDPVMTRLCEASLFVSMLPLHIDRPRKVVAFALTAARILDEIAPRPRSRS